MEDTAEKTIKLEEGMECVHKGLNKLKVMIEGERGSFTSDEYVMLYTYPWHSLRLESMLSSLIGPFHLLLLFVLSSCLNKSLLNSTNSTIYNMCTQKAPHDYSQQLYDKYKEAVEDYILTIVRNFGYLNFIVFRCYLK